MGEISEARFRRRMEEAVLLPPGDPEREAVETALADEARWAEEEWLGLVREAEALRLALRRVPVPAGLAERLLAVPGTASPKSSARVTRWVGRIAAGLLLVLGVSLLWGVDRQEVHADAIERVALLAADNHRHSQLVVYETGAPGELEAKLAEGVAFEVAVPALGPDFQLQGGRNCALGGEPVCYSRWGGPGGACSLYQFPSEMFQLPLQMGRRVVTTRCAPTCRSASCGCALVVAVWSREGKAYALVMKSPEALECVRCGR